MIYPLAVTREAVAAFEEETGFRGLGERMVGAGIWKIKEDANGVRRKAEANDDKNVLEMRQSRKDRESALGPSMLPNLRKTRDDHPCEQPGSSSRTGAVNVHSGGMIKEERCRKIVMGPSLAAPSKHREKGTPVSGSQA
jgi:hypothetical protein